MSAKINYSKDCPLKGMHGPKTTIAKPEMDGDGFKTTLMALNPSPLDIDSGIVKQEIWNADGTVTAQQKGKTYLLRGESTYLVTGKATGEAAGTEATLVATGMEEDNWHNETVTAFEVPVLREFSAGA